MRSTDTNSWQPTSWQSRKAQQQPSYGDSAELERAVADLARLPPIVVSWEVENLRLRLAAAQRGEAFLLQGDLRAWEGTTEICHREWDRSIPRDFV